MSFPRFACLGLLSLCAGVGAACGSGSSPARTSGTTGSGGSGGASASASTGTGGVEDAGSDAPSEVYPAPFAPPPQVAAYGGPVLKKPKIVPVFFAGDDATFQGELEDFVSKIGSSSYWTTAVGEYGVGAATAAPTVQLTETAPVTIDDTAIQTWLQGKLDGDDPLWPANDGNTVYALHYPSGTTITLQGSSSCTEFGGYHNDTVLDANHGGAFVAYAVIPRCMTFDTTPPLNGIDAVTGAESHELAESATDPYPQDDPAYVTVDNAHYYWVRVLGGGEVGDMCAQFPGAFTKFPGLDYTVQRIWSNKQAKAGHDPCQPELAGEVYFNSSPVLPDAITIDVQGQSFVAQGVVIALGQSRTIDVELFSEAATSGAWTVTAENTTQTPELGFSFDKSTGANGDVLHLTIALDTASKRGTETFILKSTLGTQENFWIGLVATPTAVDAGVDSGTDGGAEDDGGAGGGPADGGAGGGPADGG